MLKTIFNKHTLHYLHYAMMAGMVCGAAVLSGGAALAATPAFQAAAAGGAGAMQISIPNILAAIPDASWSMLQGFGDLPQLIEGVSNAAQAGELWHYDYQWGLMNHGAMDHSGVDAVSHVGGHLGEHAAGHDVTGSFDTAAAADSAHSGHDSCSVQDMIEWQGTETDLPLIDDLITDGLYGSRAEYFSEFCHDHS